NAHLVHFLTIRDVEAERTERGAHARADAVADGQVQIRQRIDGVAGIDEHAESPERVDPPDRIDADDTVVASRHDGIADVHAQACEVVAAHRRAAAGAEQQRRRNAVATARQHGACFRAQVDLAIFRQGNPCGVLPANATERTRGYAGDAHARE